MSFVLFILFYLINILSAQTNCDNSCNVCLTNDNFREGSYTVKDNNQKICLGEDIVFKPDNLIAADGDVNINGDTITGFPNSETEFPGSTILRQGPYCLGYFAAVVIEASDIEFDLNGHSIEMSREMYLQQRWFAIIEVGTAPFISGQGPNDFLGDLEFVNTNNVLIHNGRIGLSSHHGIHSNNAGNVTLRDLVVKDFEVGGIQFNGFETANFENLDIGPSANNVPVYGSYSSARFILAALRKAGLHEDEVNVVPFHFGDQTYKQIYDNLKKMLDLIYDFVINNNEPTQAEDITLWNNNKDMFLNAKRLPDGATLYGILLKKFGAGTGAIGGNGPNVGDEFGKSAVLKNIIIHDLQIHVREVPLLMAYNCDSTFDADTGNAARYIMRGPFGDVIDARFLFAKEFQHYIDENRFSEILSQQYVGNVLANAKIALARLNTNTNIARNVARFSGRSNINEDKVDGTWGGDNWANNPFLNWVFGGNALDQCINLFMCNGDVMAHSNKGLIGLRIDSIATTDITDIDIRNLHNKSPLTTFACKNFTGSHDGGSPGNLEDEGGMTGDVRGISMWDSTVTIRETSPNFNRIRRLKSDYGDVTGFHQLNSGDILCYNSNGNNSCFRMNNQNLVGGNLLTDGLVDELISMGRIPYPNNFYACQILQDDGLRLFVNDVQVQSSDIPACQDNPIVAAKGASSFTANMLNSKDGINIKGNADSPSKSKPKPSPNNATPIYKKVWFIVLLSSIPVLILIFVVIFCTCKAKKRKTLAAHTERLVESDALKV